MLPSKERILEVLENNPEGICDDCLSKQAGVYPRQQVNSICRYLSNTGRAERKRDVCSLCRKLKTANLLCAGTSTPLSVGIEKALRTPSRGSDAKEELDSIRREIIGIFCEIDPTKRGHSGRKETFSERLARLQNAEKIPDKICSMIRLLNSFRNLAVYERCIVGSDELALLEDAWKLVERWWTKSKIRGNKCP